jgi:hypothetical protein
VDCAYDLLRSRREHAMVDYAYAMLRSHREPAMVLYAPPAKTITMNCRVSVKLERQPGTRRSNGAEPLVGLRCCHVRTAEGITGCQCRHAYSTTYCDLGT